MKTFYIFILLFPLITFSQMQTIHNSNVTPSITEREILERSQTGMKKGNNVIVLDFEGLGDLDAIEGFYDGGTSSQGYSGTNYGVYFNPDALSIIAGYAGGTGNFQNEPSPVTILFFLSGSAAIMNVRDGFETGFSFYYSSISDSGYVEVYDELDGNGNKLATISLPPLGSLDIPGGQYNIWEPVGVTFEGVAKSVALGGVADRIGFDDVTFGSDIPGITIPEPPVLLSPENESTNVPVNVTLEWEPSDGADSYRLQVSTSEDFNIFLDRGDIENTSYKVTGLAGGTTYYWRVNAENEAGTSDWSEVWSFTTAELLTVTFYVDMTNASPFNPASDDVYIAGTIAAPHWQQPGSNPDLKMEPNELYPLIYSTTLELPAGNYQHKYFRIINNVPSWDYGEWIGDPNRLIEVTDDAFEYNVWSDIQEVEKLPMVMARDVLPLGSLVTIEGVVTRTIPGSDFTRIQDETAGFTLRQTRCSDFNTGIYDGSISAGTVVRIHGTVGSFNQLRQFDQAELISYEIIGEAEPPDPTELTLADIADDGRKYQSMLIFLNDLEIDTEHTVYAEATTYSIKDPTVDFGVVDLLIPNAWDTEIVGTVVTSPFSFIGILSQSHPTDSNAGFQIMPILGSDVDAPLRVERIIGENLPTRYDLGQNYPNPFNPLTTITFSLPEQSQVTFEVYNMLGQLVNTLVSGETFDAGYYSIVWDGRDRSGRTVASGVYVYRIQAGDFISIKRMVFLK